jgi:hypothetical protein
MLVLVPSRERPWNVERLSRTAAETMSGIADLLFIFDEDDPRLLENIAAMGEYGWRYEVQPRLITVPKVNLAASRHMDERIIMFLGDDHVPHTVGWDTSVVKAIDDLGGTGFAYPWGLGRTDTPEICAISTDIIKALGWFGLPSIKHFYVDNVWADIGNGAGCITFLQDVVLEHMHWTFSKGPRDHINELAMSFTTHDEIEYRRWRELLMKHDIAVVKGLRAVL